MRKNKEIWNTPNGTIRWEVKPRKKKPHKARPVTEGSPLVNEAFNEKHRFDYLPIAKGKKRKFVFYLINMHSPTKSGYLVAKERAMWAMPTLCNMAERAYAMDIHPIHTMELTMRFSQRLPKYFHLVLLPLDEALKWQSDPNFNPYDKGKQEYGAIKYF